MGWLVFLLAQAAVAASPDGGVAPDTAANLVLPAQPAHTFDPRWSHVTTPAKGAPSSIGLPGAGCLQGAMVLPLRGPGFVVAHPERHREYGHPSLVAYIRYLATMAKKQKLGLLVVGDLGQPRGGPTPSGHRSHQNGLDVDIWYAPPKKKLSPGKAPLPPAPSVVDLRTNAILPAWNKNVAKLVVTAAANPAVDRIFVHPAIKRWFCQDKQDKSRRGPWLARLRPWWGHQDHFHVRLACPTDSPDCVASPPLPDGDGCAQIGWWFSQDAHSTAAKRGAPGEHAPSMPEACEALLP